jgi:hypothetical protein
MESTQRRYLIIIEKVSRSQRALSHYQSLHDPQGKLWGILSKPPLPSWYPQAEEILLKAGEIFPEENGFRLSYDSEDRTLYLSPRSKQYRAVVEGAVSNLVRQKRRLAQSSPSYLLRCPPGIDRRVRRTFIQKGLIKGGV